MCIRLVIELVTNDNLLRGASQLQLLGISCYLCECIQYTVLYVRSPLLPLHSSSVLFDFYWFLVYNVQCIYRILVFIAKYSLQICPNSAFAHWRTATAKHSLNAFVAALFNFFTRGNGVESAVIHI